jgi:dihydroorotate dehydrogenase
MYGLLRPLLFRLPPEQAHDVTLKSLDLVHRLGILRALVPAVEESPVEVMGLRFPNPVGLAAGLDKNAEHLDSLAALGFGFIEVGTVTPLAQPGNPKPRMFRLTGDGALINRMGFNNQGLDALLRQVRRASYTGILGINVGKNKDTSEADAELDYRKGIAAVYGAASYITVNVSSPNTPGLRGLQFGDSLKNLLRAIKEEQAIQHRQHGHYVPIAVKIAPDMDAEAVDFVASALLEARIDGVVATNTTVDREAVTGHPLAAEQGGLSGKPVRQPSLDVIRGLHARLGDNVPIIGVGGIDDGASAAEKMAAGARLVQLYTGLIYKGPALIREVVAGTKKWAR